MIKRSVHQNRITFVLQSQADIAKLLECLVSDMTIRSVINLCIQQYFHETKRNACLVLLDDQHPWIPSLIHHYVYHLSWSYTEPIHSQSGAISMLCSLYYNQQYGSTTTQQLT